MMKKDAFYKVFDYAEQHHMIKAGERLVAGISGGADSICLLFMLIEMQKKIPFTFIAVHVNHQLRGAEADRDQKFVEQLCLKNAVPCRSFSENVQQFAEEEKLTTEEAGRMIRRKCFSQVLAEENADKIVLAHHKNDNAETFLMNLARGSGLAGLCGMRPVNQGFVRPLLCLTREEIRQWLLENELGWCEDSSNASDHYTRNRVRNYLLPILEEQVNEKTVEHLQDTMEQMQGLQEFVEVQCENATKRCILKSESSALLIKKKELESEHPYLQGEILRNALVQLAGQTKDISRIHVESLKELFGKQNGREIHLPYGITAKRDYDGVWLEKAVGRGLHLQQEAQLQPETYFQAVDLKIPGETYVPWADQTLVCSVFEKKSNFSIDQMEQTPYTKWFDYDIIRNTVQIRTRQTGDFLVIHESGGRQKLKSWFINEKIPAAKRDQVLLVALEHEILWIPGYRRSNRYQVEETTKEILKIQVFGGKKDGRDNQSYDF